MLNDVNMDFGSCECSKRPRKVTCSPATLQLTLTRWQTGGGSRVTRAATRAIDAADGHRRANAEAQVSTGRREQQLVVVDAENTGQLLLLEAPARLVFRWFQRVAEFGLRDQCTQLHLKNMSTSTSIWRSTRTCNYRSRILMRLQRRRERTAESMASGMNISLMCWL